MDHEIDIYALDVAIVRSWTQYAVLITTLLALRYANDPGGVIGVVVSSGAQFAFLIPFWSETIGKHIYGPEVSRHQAESRIVELVFMFMGHSFVFSGFYIMVLGLVLNMI